MIPARRLSLAELGNLVVLMCNDDRHLHRFRILLFRTTVAAANSPP